ncbi:TonB-dependent receptor [Tenacibaculum jejuense]|uniref:Probable TonB-dependent outer membrane receptor n=1 Tax=Tenacibaculum jejuense TaxID=584609 RepID=A0A238UG91_9FLAO|nr:TonB-dependent receptor [Tenacibaculum jejuense]SNR17568.1 Probable TonB-dependent outer membrane receptor precursor [Tenacibaculum jejuense]
MRWIFLLFLLVSTTLFSQEVTVYDAETGKVIEAVAVFNKDKSKSGVTNENGKVDLTMFSNEVIYFSHVSYAEFSSKKSVILLNNNEVFLSKESEQLDEVVVSVFKNKAKTKRIAEQIEVIKAREIQKIAAQSSADVLANVPGIRVQRSQFGGGSPVLRGMESNRVLLVVDGVRMNNAIYRKGHLQNSITVAPSMLDRTEVVFGPTSVTYGSDALGGVIHYYTKTPKLSKNKEVKSNFFSRFSTVNNEITNQASVELQFPKWGSFTSVSHSNFGDLKMGENRSHGFEDWGKITYFSENVGSRFVSTPTLNSDPNLQRNTGYNQTDILQKFYVPLSKSTDLKINIQYSTSSDVPRFDRLTELTDEADPATLKFAEWYYGPQNRLLISPQLEINPKKKWMKSGVFTLAYQNIKESRIQRKFGSLQRSYREEEVDIFSLNGDFAVPLAKHRDLGYGFEVAYNDVNSNSFGKELDVVNNEIIGFNGDFAVQSRYADGGSSYLSSALYVDYRQDISKRSTLNSGIRLTNTQLRAKWVDDAFITLPDNDISLSNTAVTFSVGYVHKPAENWKLNAVISSGFRSPNIDDVGKVREKGGNVTVPNVNLRPEHAYSGEIGLEKYFNDRKFKIGANVYYTLLTNYIYRDDFILNGQSTIRFDGVDGNNIVANVNRDNAYVTGFTMNYQGKLFKNWTTTGSITYTKGRTFDTDQPMSSIPPLFGNFDVNYVTKKVEAGVNFRFNAKKDIDDFNIDEGIDNHEQTPIVDINASEETERYFGSPSWQTLSAFARYNLSNNFSLQARVDNIFDEHYREFASGVSAPGRNLSVSLFANF